MRQSFWETIGHSFKSVSGTLSTVISLIASVIAFALTTWSIAIVVLGGTVLTILLATFIHAAYKGYKNSANPLPEILHVSEPSVHESAHMVCLLESSELFSNDIFVSFYNVAEQGFEVLIGIGVVINVQTEDGKIQVALTDTTEGYEEEVNKLKRNDAAALRNTRVKPTVPARYLRSMLQGGP